MPRIPEIHDFEPARPFSFFTAAWEAVRLTRPYFRFVAREKSIPPPALFLSLCYLLPALLSYPAALMTGREYASILQYYLSSGVQAVIAAVVFHFSVRVCLRNKMTLGQTLRVYAYSGGVWLISFVWVLLPQSSGNIFLAAVTLLHLCYITIGLKSAARVMFPLAVAAVLVMLIIMALIGVVFGWV